MAKPGRPKKTTLKTDLKLHGEHHALRWILERNGIQLIDFAKALDRSPASVTRYLKGVNRAPPRELLRTAALVAGTADIPTPPNIHIPSFWHHPALNIRNVNEHNHKKGLTSEAKDLRIPARLNSNRVFRKLSYVPRIAATIDRLSVTFDVPWCLRDHFESVVQKMLTPKFEGEKKRYFKAFKAKGGVLHFSPVNQNALLDPETAAVSESNFARVEFYPPVGNQEHQMLLQKLVWPFFTPSSMQVTRIDIAFDYELASFPLLHFDHRLEKEQLAGPNHPLLLGESANVRLGRGGGERFVRAYDKFVERADRLLKTPSIAAGIRELAWLGVPDDDPTVGSQDLHQREVVDTLRYDPANAYFYPNHLSGWGYAHRIEFELRPKRIRKKKVFDRHPIGLLKRLNNELRPFDDFQVMHLGFLEPGSFWTPFLLAARFEGVQRQSSGLAGGLDQILTKITSVSIAAGVEQPRAIFSNHRALLQTQLNSILGVS